jgi:polyvinyl alcohol dehydrogenase (cytochrome)
VIWTQTGGCHLGGLAEQVLMLSIIHRARWFGSAVMCAVVVLPACAVVTGISAAATSFGGGTSTAGPCVSVPRHGGWSDYRNGPANTGENAADTEIDRASVAVLTPQWQKDKLVGVTGTPVVSAGVVYFGDETGTQWAVKLSSGAVLWSTKVVSGVIGSPAIVGSALYVGAGSALYRLNATNGQVEWKVTTNANPYSQINASPVVVGHLVILGTAQFEEVVGRPPETFQGSIGAWDTRTGKQVWNFVTTRNDASSGAGVGIWSTPAVDPRLGLLYVGTGQNISQPTGRLADSLLAIRISNGRLAWWSQFTTPDVFGVGDYTGKDADVGASPNLWSCHGRDLVGVGQKNGVYHALDAKTGKDVWNARLTPGSTFGGVLGSAAFLDGRLIVTSNVGDPTTNATTNRSTVVALNPGNGKGLWSKNLAGNVFAPVTGVRGLAFIGTDAGHYYALSTASGTQEWTYAPPAQVGGGASIVGAYVIWGYGFTLFKGPGQGGVVCFSITGAGRVHQERGGMVPSSVPTTPST